MAASGINEHNEARRKERVILKQAKWKKQLESMPDNQYTAPLYGSNNNNNTGQRASGNSYERELDSRAQCRVVGSPPGVDSHDARAVDRYCDDVGMAAKTRYYNEKNCGVIKTDAYRCNALTPTEIRPHQLPTRPQDQRRNEFHFKRVPVTTTNATHQQLTEKLDQSSSNCVLTPQQRRMDHYNRQQTEYSAKINGRYRNFDYISQW